MPAPIRVFTAPGAIGAELAPRLLRNIETAREAGRRFLLGCPTGRTPRPIYEEIGRLLAKTHQDVSNLVLVMMDEYVIPEGDGFRYADDHFPWSSHHFARAELFDRWNHGLPHTHRMRAESIWFPDPKDPPAYDSRIIDAGGVDFFILASGASDGHIAFNPPGSARDSRTRIIALPDATRRDNLKTFPDFKTLDAVPKHGVSVGIETIASTKECAMVVWGEGKRKTLAHMRDSSRYDARWPATIIHECRGGEILCDEAANSDGS